MLQSQVHVRKPTILNELYQEKVVKSRQKLVDEYQNHLVEVQLDNEHLTKTNGGDVYIFEPVCTLIYSNLYNQFLFAPSHQIVFTSSKTISQQFLKL